MASIIDGNTQRFAGTNQQAGNKVNYDDGLASLGTAEAAVVGAGRGTTGAATVERGVVNAVVAATSTMACRIIIVAFGAVHAAAHLLGCV